MAKLLKAIYTQENKKTTCKNIKAVVADLRSMKMKFATKRAEDGMEV